MTIHCGGERRHGRGDIRALSATWEEIYDSAGTGEFHPFDSWQCDQSPRPNAPLSQWDWEKDHYLSNNDNLIYPTLPFQMYETLSEALNPRISVPGLHSSHCADVFWQCQSLSSTSTIEVCVTQCIQCVFLSPDQCVSYWLLSGRHKRHTHARTHTAGIPMGVFQDYVHLKSIGQCYYREGPLCNLDSY